MPCFPAGVPLAHNRAMFEPLRTITHSPDETQAFASALAHVAPPGKVLALAGDLGAGKTQFAKGFVAGLGGNPARVTSPTFVLVHEYPTRAGVVWHVDAYRFVGDAGEELVLGLPDAMNRQDGFVLIEWPSRMATDLPRDAWQMQFSHEAPESRKIVASIPATAWQQVRDAWAWAHD